MHKEVEMPVKKKPQPNQFITPNAFFTPANFTPASGAGRGPNNQRISNQSRSGSGGEERPRSFPLEAQRREGEGRKAFVRRIGDQVPQEETTLTAEQVLATQKQREEATGDLGETVAPTEILDENARAGSTLLEEGQVLGSIVAGAGAGAGIGAFAGGVGALPGAVIGGLLGGAREILKQIKDEQKQVTINAYESFGRTTKSYNDILNMAEAGVDPATIAFYYNQNLANAREAERVLSYTAENKTGKAYTKATDELRTVRAWLQAEEARRFEIAQAINNPTGTAHVYYPITPSDEVSEDRVGIAGF